MKHRRGFAAALALLSIVFGASSGKAAQDSFEIQLNELRPASVGTIKAQQQNTNRSEAAKTPEAAKKTKTRAISTYTVRPGDNLFAILMQRYILSNEAAEQLIPEIIRMNNIRDPKVLTVGQHLTIPLPAQTTRAQSAKKLTLQKIPDAKTALPEISISAAPPCILANDILKNLHLLNPPTNLVSGENTIMAEHAGIKLIIACGLSPDNSYTYERLLAHNDLQLLVFTGTESSRYVIRKLANRLSLSYQQPDPDATIDLPATYLFPAFGPNGQDIRITIVPKKDNN